MIINEKKVLICGFLDFYANSVRPKALEEYFTKNGVKCELFNTQLLSKRKHSLTSNITDYVTSFLGSTILIFLDLQNKFFKLKNRQVNFFLLWLKLHIRGFMLASLLKDKAYEWVVIENALDSYAILYFQNKKCVYDCPTPLADELKYSDSISDNGYEQLLKDEIKIYSKSTILTFHWPSYNQYISKYYTGKNMVKVPWGCDKKSRIVTYSFKPSIVYIGRLGGYWVDLNLLSHLSKQYNIDVYGGPEPPADLNINFKGYAIPEEVLPKYQFGLITCTKDELRKNGFSAKHMEYLSYGLPVLVPEWRESAKSMGGTVFYNEKNFKEVVVKASIKKEWEELHKSALEYSEELQWKNVFKPLEKAMFSK